MKSRIIVCGLGRTGCKIFHLLKQQGAAVTGINDRPVPDLQADEVIIGDARASTTLLAAGIAQAQTLVLAQSDDALNLAILTQARVLNPNLQIVNRLYNQTLGDRLDQTLPKHLSMSVAQLAAPIFTFAALGNQAIGQLRLFDQTWPIYEETIDENHPWLGKLLSDLWDNRARMLICYCPADGEQNLVSALGQGVRLQVGDRIVIGTQPIIIRANRRSRLRKLLRTFSSLRHFQHHGRPVIVVTLTLLVSIFLATLTYIWANFNTNFIDALYFTVGMITGAGGQEEVVEQSTATIKVFTAVMMLVGAGIIGICYALINDFILGSRLKQFWDVARVPSRSHYIVCGLGGIGMQIVQQLHRQGHEVVVIESDPQNRFLRTVRSLGIPILLEDASLANTLEAANVQTAEALLAITSNDTSNLQIGLTAKAIVPKLPTIVRVQDAEFTKSVRQVFEFEAVLCPTELATPSFAAAALGGKILGNGLVGNLLWIAIATMITPAHPFCHQRVQDVAVAANLVPLYLERDRRTIHGWNLLEATLTPGDILYLTIPATELEQLWRGNASQLIVS